MPDEIIQSSRALEYCRSIVSEVKTLEKLLVSAKIFDEQEDDECRQMRLELAGEAGEDPDLYVPSVLDYINCYCLECTAQGERSSALSQWIISGFRLLRAYGGPDTTICWQGSDQICIFVHCASGSAHEYFQAPNIAAALAELANL